MMKIIYRNFVSLLCLLLFAGNALYAAAPRNSHAAAFTYYAAGSREGLIGATEASPIDNPADNIFHVALDEPLLGIEQVWLEYELEGVADHTAVARSINDQLAAGGYVVKKRRGWALQRERLDARWLRQGDNVIRFSLPQGAKHSYRVRNISLQVDRALAFCQDGAAELVVHQPQLHDRGQAYVKGFLAGALAEGAKVTIDGKAARLHKGSFEAMVTAIDKWGRRRSIAIEARLPDGQVLCRQLAMNQLQQADYSYGLETGVHATQKFVAPEAEAGIMLAGAELSAKARSLKQASLLSITSLRAIDLPALDPGMVNVTRYHEGYRFLPHGTQFEKEVKLRLAYDESRIPEGYSVQDIRTYYFDEESHHWIPLPLDSVVQDCGDIFSRTTHFTDMINAIIQVPESPEVQAYNSTSMKGIKAANPMAGFNLLSPPQANNTGSASMGYPLNLPAGRAGMQPQLAISYNSGGGNDWLGLGWNLSIPAITVDTRWGVPRYDPKKETETYSMGGEQLSPVAHRGELQERNTAGDKQFYPRVEGAFNKIMRHGNHPSKYTWEVTTKSGVKYYYGGSSDRVEENAVLKDAAGNIAHWALVKVEDLNGNSVSYFYDRQEDAGIAGSTVMGQQLYPTKIRYTDHTSGEGRYQVHFMRDRDLGEQAQKRRKDVTINARYGFKQVTADLLRKIVITYGPNPTDDITAATVRSYELKYDRGSEKNFYKTLLTNIIEYDANDAFFNEHSFAYYNDVAADGGPLRPLADQVGWNVGDQEIKGDLLIEKDGFGGEASVLSGTSSDDFSTSVSVVVGPGLNVATKSNSAGGNVGFGKSFSEGVTTLVDLNGDGRPDKVFMQGDILKYSPNMGVDKNGAGTFGTPVAVKNGRQFQRDKTTSFNGGVEGHAGIGAASVMVGVSGSTSKTQTTAYFADVNGDQLVDIVDNGKVYFNYLDKDGIPAFTTESGDTPSQIDASGSFDSSLFPSQEAEVAQAKEKNPLHDMVRLWIAPYDGKIKIEGDVALLPPTVKDIDEKADGVVARIQHQDSQPWSTTIEAGDYLPKQPSGVSSLSVRKGDHVYFRLQSRDNGSHDEVAWSPVITYLAIDPELRDANNKQPGRFAVAEDFMLTAPQEITAPYTGSLVFKTPFHKDTTSDDVTFEIIHIEGSQESPQVTIAKTYAFAWDSTYNDSLTSSLQVKQGDRLKFRIRSTSNIDWPKLVCKPFIYYDQIEVAEGEPKMEPFNKKGEPVIKFHAVVDYRMYNQQLAYAAPYVMPVSDTLTISGSIATKTAEGFRFSELPAYLTVKKRNELVYKDTLKLSDRQDTLRWQTQVVADSAEQFFVELHIPAGLMPAGLQLTDKTEAIIGGDTTHIFQGLSMRLPGDSYIFGPLYRSWGHFSYNGNGQRADEKIRRSELKIDRQKMEAQSDIDVSAMETGEDLEKADTYDPASENYIVLLPDGAGQHWLGYDDLSILSGEKMQSSRFGADDLSAVALVSGSGALAVNKVTRSSSVSAVAGGSYGMGSGSLSTSSGTSRILTDYMDLNGDRYPDLLTEAGVQYTNALGGFSERKHTFSSSDVTTSKTTTTGLSASVTPISSDVKPANKILKVVSIGGGRNSAGLSGSYAGGTNYSAVAYMDINGDGLADRLLREEKDEELDIDKVYVQLNLGYSFAAPEPWSFGAIQKGFSDTGSAGLGFSLVGGSISGGIGASLSTTKSEKMLLDVNGDGLPDYCYRSGTFPDYDKVEVMLNTGNGFVAPVLWAGAELLNQTSSVSTSGNVGFTVGFTLGVFSIKVNPSVSTGKGMSREVVGFRDVDGDGHADFVTSGNSTELLVRRSTIGRTNLLREVKRPLGASFALSYEQLGNTYEMPNSSWVLSAVAMQDGHAGDGQDRLLNTFAYEDGYYDRHERDFYGFGKVISSTHDTGDGDKVYTRLVQTFSTENYYTKGLLLTERLEDAKGKPYVEKENIYKLRRLSVTAGQKPALQDAPLEEDVRMFPMLSESWQRFYEGGEQAGKKSQSRFKYDAWGNVERIEDLGDSGSEDDLFATVKYHYLEKAYVMGMPESIIVKGADKTYRRREADIYPNGQVKQIRQYLNDEEAAVHDLKYDTYGNLEQIIRPANAKEQRLEVNYAYDDQVHTYVTSTRNSYDYSSSATYDYKFGQLLSSKDLNGQEIKYQLDDVGRVTQITGPYEIASGAEYTIRFVYHPEAEIPWALTEHYDPEHPENPLQTATFVDGLGRVLQTKKDAAIYQGEGAADKEMMIASGKLLYDGLGRAVEAYYPVLGKANAPEEFITEVDAIKPTTTKYDVLGRATKVTLPDGAITQSLYGFGSDRSGNKQFMTKTIDANGIATEQYTDIRGRVTGVKNSGDVWTSFVYNALGEQLEAINDLGHSTLSEYDLLGRRIRREHPDAGVTEYRYDLVGNLTELITANLKDAGAGAISYDYDFERLTEIHYPQNPENDVKYSYGPAGAAENRAGRIERQEDATGAQDFYYGPLGEVVKNVRTVIIPQHEEQTFVTEWRYDSWNRLTGMTYADGEKLAYTYNVGGLLHSMKGKKKSVEYKYVQQLGYDKFEQRVFLHYGNDTKTNYEYEPDRRRLKNMVAKTANGRAMMDNVYEYDKVNNILSLKNTAPIPSSSLMGGASEYHYQYDDLYRLTEAQGSFKGSSQEHRYSLSMQYNSVGGIENKSQSHEKKGSGQNEWAAQKKTSYQQAYAYGTEQPNAPVHIGEQSYSYDANGNQTGWIHDKSGQKRQILWDEENRIRSIYDNGASFHYTYDASGERVLKGRSEGQSMFVNGTAKGGSGAMGNYTVYVNPYLVLKSGSYTKHFYIEGQRIVSKIGDDLGDATSTKKAGSNQVNYQSRYEAVVEGIVRNLKFLGQDGVMLTAGKSGKTPPGQVLNDGSNGNGGNGGGTNGGSGKSAENFQYYFHPDHLGSTSYITDASGEVYQHLEYFAFGETFVEEHSNTDRVPYKFNGKELDEETGLYYYGARYYDARTSVFVSVDPLAEMFPNVSSFAYPFNNPLRYKDPTGMSGEDVTDPTTEAKVNEAEAKYGALADQYAVTAKRLGDGGGNTNVPGATGVHTRSEQSNPVGGDTGSPSAQIVREDTKQNGGYDNDKAVEWLNSNAHESWKDAKGQCAKYVRQALEAGGLNTTGRPVPARLYSAFLPKLGFNVINTTSYEKGDIAVIEGYSGAKADPNTGLPYGHIQMYNGSQWISDFKQNDFWPGGGYRKNQPDFQIFRWVIVSP